MNSSIFFLGVAVVGAILAVAGVVTFLRSHFRNEQAVAIRARQAHPIAPLEKRAWWSLGVGIVMGAAIALEFITQGTTGFFENRQMRMWVTAILLAGMVAYVILLRSARLGKARGEVVQDERDRNISGKAPAVQLIAVLFSVAAWAIALTEVYWDRGAIPIVFPYMIFWSVFVVELLAGSIAILVGYRRM